MSRLGKTPIVVPKGIEVKMAEAGVVIAKGPKGAQSLKLPNGISVRIDPSELLVECDESAK